MLAALSAGYILYYYSEAFFWARYKPDDTLPGLVFTYLVYCLVAYVVLSVVTAYRVRSIWALFLTGALYGWLIEGVIVQTMYDFFPFQIAWTGLAWHALISVFIGWYYVVTVLLQNNYKKTMGISVFLGVFYGTWAVYWWNEGSITPVPAFFVYSLLITFFLILSYWFYCRLHMAVFEPTRLELVILAGAFIFFYSATVYIQPLSLIILPPLLGIVYAALRKNKKIEQRATILEALQGEITFSNCALLFSIPLTATFIYWAALSLSLLIGTNWMVAVITVPLGVIMFVVSVAKIFRNEQPA